MFVKLNLSSRYIWTIYKKGEIDAVGTDSLDMLTCAGYFTTVFNVSALAGMCLELVCESEGNESVSYCKEDSTCILQGIIVFLMGLSILFDLSIEWACRNATPAQRSRRTAFVSVVVLPAYWLLLASTVVSSKSYYCTDMPCIAKHFLYPVLITLRNPDMRRALLVFGSAMGTLPPPPPPLHSLVQPHAVSCTDLYESVEVCTTHSGTHSTHFTVASLGTHSVV